MDVTIESRIFSKLLEKIDKIYDFITLRQSIEEEAIVLSSEDLAELLHVSTRTLQRLRKDNLIAYTMFRGKCRYSLSSIRQDIKRGTISCDPQTIDDFKKKYLSMSRHLNK